MAFRQDGKVMRGIAWRAVEREAFVTEHRGAIDLAFSLEQDTWNGEALPAALGRRLSGARASLSRFGSGSRLPDEPGPSGLRARAAILNLR